MRGSRRSATTGWRGPAGASGVTRGRDRAPGSHPAFLNLYEESPDDRPCGGPAWPRRRSPATVGLMQGERANPQVTVIIVNYNSGPCLARCLAALARQTWRDFDAIVVDNDSTDESRLALEG